MSFRNRCVIAGSNGPVLLSIPLVEGRDQRKPMREVQIDNKSDWKARHWKTIVSCYNRSPWFDYYRHSLEKLFQVRHYLLYEWNLDCWSWAIQQLGIEINQGLTQDYQPFYDTTQYEDWRGKLMPSTIARQFTDPVRYRQVFEERTGFIPHLSILDLLFCAGNQSLELLSH